MRIETARQRARAHARALGGKTCMCDTCWRYYEWERWLKAWEQTGDPLAYERAVSMKQQLLSRR